jgi:hypothetical protein
MLRGQLKLDRFNKVSLARRFDLIGFIAPEGELLSFARPRQLLLRCSNSCIHAVEKKVTKDKSAWSRFGCEARVARVPGWHESAGRPVAACILCSSLLCPLRVFAEGCQKGLLSLWQRASSMKRPFGLFSPKAAVLGAANGMKPPVRNISYLTINAKNRRL